MGVLSRRLLSGADVDDAGTPIRCLDDHGDGTCEGEVRHRMPLSGTGRSFPRCDRHWSARLDEQERISEAYPDSDVPPDWFDPMDAGERWDDE